MRGGKRGRSARARANGTPDTERANEPRRTVERERAETNGTAEPADDDGRRDPRNGSERSARTRGDGGGCCGDGGVNNVDDDDDTAAGAGRTVAPAAASNSIASSRRRPSRAGPSRSPSLASDDAATATNTTREGDADDRPGPLDVEGNKNGEGEPRVSFPWCVMGCFGSQSSKAGQDDSKNQKRRSDAITRQLQKDKQIYRATHRLLLLGESQLTIISRFQLARE